VEDAQAVRASESRVVLVINAGSSSIKFSVFDAPGDEPVLRLRGQVEGLGGSPRFRATGADGTTLAQEDWPADGRGTAHDRALARLAPWLAGRIGPAPPMAVGHRVVHGGATLRRPMRIDGVTMRTLEGLVPLAPLHQPHNLAGIRAAMVAWPEAVQVACFDTAFHRDHPDVADRFGLPRSLHDRGVRRFGFHGLSYEYIAGALARVAPEVAGGRVIVAHLGAGASMCAMRAGRSVDSTMGMTALDGLPMATRCGSLDPGAVLHLLRDGLDADELEDLLYRRSGLLGMSGVSGDMRMLLDAARRPGGQAAREAIETFIYRVNRELGALAATIGGLDALIFTAGIGERSAEIRARVCHAAAWLGVRIDEEANRRGDARLSPAGHQPQVWVLHTDEAHMIARHTLALVGGPAPGG